MTTAQLIAGSIDKPATKSKNFMQVLANRLMAIDLLVSLFSAAFLYICMFGIAAPAVAYQNLGQDFAFSLSPLAAAGLMLAIWWVAFVAFKSNSAPLAGTGVAEYVLVTKATFAVLVVFAFCTFAFKIDVSRMYVLLSLGLGNILLISHRWFARQWLLRQRAQGLQMRRVAIIAPPAQGLRLAKSLISKNTEGYLPVVLATPQHLISASTVSKASHANLELVAFDVEDIEFVDRLKIDTCILSAGNEIDSQTLKSLAWKLEGGSTDLVVAPGLVDIASPRVVGSQIDGTALLHVALPSFSRGQKILKRLFDIFFSIFALILTSPIFLATAIVIKLDDGGPVFFRQTRIGLGGKEFTIWKFRSMVVDAEAKLATLMAAGAHDGNEVLFKLKADPRITRAGSFIRKYSIDELPQFLNTLMGTMSVVGPRPPLASEVDKYGTQEGRRLNVKPGITGPWQVGGRSDLSWEDSLRLDLSYVENWEILSDCLLVLKTMRLIFKSVGSY